MMPRLCLAISLASLASLIVLLLAGASGGGEVAVPVMLVTTLVLGGIGYGVTKQKADAAHARIDRQEKASVDMEKRLDTKLDAMGETLTDLRVLIAERLPKPKGNG
jgi:hypothetical protein